MAPQPNLRTTLKRHGLGLPGAGTMIVPSFAISQPWLVYPRQTTFCDSILILNHPPAVMIGVQYSMGRARLADAGPGAVARSIAYEICSSVVPHCFSNVTLNFNLSPRPPLTLQSRSFQLQQALVPGSIYFLNPWWRRPRVEYLCPSSCVTCSRSGVSL